MVNQGQQDALLAQNQQMQAMLLAAGIEMPPGDTAVTPCDPTDRQAAVTVMQARVTTVPGRTVTVLPRLAASRSAAAGLVRPQQTYGTEVPTLTDPNRLILRTEKLKTVTAGRTVTVTVPPTRKSSESRSTGHKAEGLAQYTRAHRTPGQVVRTADRQVSWLKPRPKAQGALIVPPRAVRTDDRDSAQYTGPTALVMRMRTRAMRAAVRKEPMRQAKYFTAASKTLQGASQGTDPDRFTVEVKKAMKKARAPSWEQHQYKRLQKANTPGVRVRQSRGPAIDSAATMSVANSGLSKYLTGVHTMAYPVLVKGATGTQWVYKAGSLEGGRGIV
jgi:hypothetical protein